MTLVTRNANRVEINPKNFTGVVPAVMLFNPKYAHNVGTVLRACSCYGIPQLWFTGSRVPMEADPGERLPREERMKGYADVTLVNYERIFDKFPQATPVCIELRENVESLQTFVHPENALYVFGPEDGSVPAVVARHCHRFVAIPSRHCLNLGAAVYTVLYDRQTKLNPNATLNSQLTEERGWV